MVTTLSLIVFFAMISQWVAWRFKFPAVISLVIVGFICGPVLGFINPKVSLGEEFIFSIVELCVALVLFDGAMQLKFKEFKIVSSGLKQLLSVGVIVHFLLISLSAYFVLNASLGIACLLGGILIVTGPTVILPALREAKVNKRVSHFLKWEGIITDPIGAIIAVVVYDSIILSKIESTSKVLSSLGIILLIAIMVSFLSKKLISYSLEKNLVPTYLQIPFITGVVICSFALSNYFHEGSGLLAVTALGFFVGNSRIEILHNLQHFKENVTTIFIGFVFILISSSISLNVFNLIEMKHVIFIFLVAFVLRVISIYLSTINSEMTLSEKLLIGFYGPRGIVAASVAAAIGSNMTKRGIEGGEMILPVIFLIILTTVIIHGLSLNFLARKLELNDIDRNGVIFMGTMPWVFDFAEKLQDLGISVMVTSASWHKLSPARERGIPYYYGQILDELESENLDLNDYNYFVAMGENDAFNLLSCDSFSKRFGAQNVFHLKHSRNILHDLYKIEKKNYCIITNNLELRYENLMRYYQYGWSFKATPLTEEYSYQDYVSDNPQAIECVLLRDSSQLIFSGKYDKAKIKKGDVIISFSPKFKSNIIEPLLAA